MKTLKYFIAAIVTLISCVSVSAQSWRYYGGGSRWKTHGFDLSVCGCYGTFGKQSDVSYDNVIDKSMYNVQNKGVVCGIGLTVYNVYAEVQFRSPHHSRSYDVCVWDDESSYFAWHVGYMLPLHRKFSITPMIGMGILKTGYVDGSDWYVSSDGVYNKFLIDDVIK